MIMHLHKLVIIAAAVLVTPKSTGPVPLIIDTDMTTDVDDVGAVCAANALMDRGEADIIAIVHNTGYPKGIAAVAALNKWYGREDIPLGAFKGEFGKNVSGHYDEDIADNFPNTIRNYTQVPGAVEVYRKVLAKAADRSVAISSIGFMTNLRDLLQSPADEYSKLNGTELVAAKVKLVAMMGGYYPSSPKSEFNFDCGKGQMVEEDECRGSTKFVVDNMPSSVKFVFSGFELGVIVNSGAALTNCAPDNNPCRKAYIDYRGPDKDRYSWDPVTTLYAVRGLAAINSTEAGRGGRNDVDSEGNNKWVQSSDSSSQSYLVLAQGAEGDLGRTLDALYCAPPKKGSI